MTKKKTSQAFKKGDYVVYPTHGVGRVTGEEKQTIGEHAVRLYVIAFEKDKMTLRVPVTRAEQAGLRPLSDSEQMERAFDVLRGRPKIARGMWSRRAQEYESKINSGDIMSVSEVVRDLHRNVGLPDRSYSERVIYESALNRLAMEVAMAQQVELKEAIKRVTVVLDSRKKALEDADTEVEAA